MAEPRQLSFRVATILTTCFLLFHRSSSAPPAGSSTLCIPRERDALLDVKAGLIDPGNVLSSWQQAAADCCLWAGVVCSNHTGHVVALQINSPAPYGSGNGPFGTIGGEIRSSLLALRHLKLLDLSSNNFGGEPIPDLIGALGSLTLLDLSYSNFGGRIPPHLGNLSNLEHLSLGSFDMGSDSQARAYSPDLAWLSRLRKLQAIYMSGVDLSAAVHWAHAINMLPRLIHLDFSSCSLHSTVPPPVHSNLTSLETMDLSFNTFNTSLGANFFNWDLPSLRELFLYGCGIHGPIPDALGNLTTIQLLLLHENHFTGAVPLAFEKLKKLQWFQLTDNFINMDVTELLHRLPSDDLRTLYLDNNHLTGSLPAWIGQFSSLTTIKLNNNKLSGEIPVGIGGLTNLTDLWLNSNNLHGTVTQEHFTNLNNLQHLWISDNSLTVTVNQSWNTPFSLISAGFSSCVLGPQFPAWVYCPTLHTLDVSNTSIHDEIPGNFWIGSYRAKYLDLSRNRLVGLLPTYFLFGGMEVDLLDISSNQLVGPIPTLPNYLFYLDLSGNNLSGALPSDIGAPMLEVLLLFNNSFSGTIPCSLLQLQQLIFLDLSKNMLNGTLHSCSQGYKTSNITMLNLSNNNLSGAFPLFLQGCRELNFLDLAYNKFYGSLPTWFGSKLPQLAFLRLRSNMLSGGIPSQLTRMKRLQYLDIACNNMSGNIPQPIGNLIAMKFSPNDQGALFRTVNFGFAGVYKYTDVHTDSTLVDTKGQQLEYTRGIAYMVLIDFSCNHLTGQIPEEIGMLVALKSMNLSWNTLSDIVPQSIGELRALESFDLSHNELSGEIPTSLSALTSLTRMNLSYNNLTGTIPSGNQLRTLDDQASIYIGNPGLCGPPLTRNCSGTDKKPLSLEQYEGMSDVVAFYVSMCIGFVVGLWIVFCGFLFKRKWRVACFSISDHMYDRVYVKVVVGWASLARKFRQG